MKISTGVKELAIICNSVIHKTSDLDTKFRLKGIQRVWVPVFLKFHSLNTLGTEQYI